jgi:hypothetical protein
MAALAADDAQHSATTLICAGGQATAMETHSILKCIETAIQQLFSSVVIARERAGAPSRWLVQ